MATFGGVLGLIVYFVFFKKTPEGAFSGFGMPTLFMLGGAVIFSLIGNLFSSSGKKK